MDGVDPVVIVRDIMTPMPITVEPSVPLPDAIALMKTHRIRRLPVMSRGSLKGIVTDRDLSQACPPSATTMSAWELPTLLSHTTVRDCMQRTVVTIGPDDTVEHAALLMNQKKIGGLPVTDEGKLVGIITESDIFRCFTTMLGAEPGFLQIAVRSNEQTRLRIALLLRFPELQTVCFHPLRPEVLLVFKTPHGLSDAQRILDEVRSYQHFPILSWCLSEPNEAPFDVRIPMSLERLSERGVRRQQPV